LLTLFMLVLFFQWSGVLPVVRWLTAIFAVITAIYTAFLFAQAKGRDFWQSPSLALHMLVHAFMAGGATYAIFGLFMENGAAWLPYLRDVMLVSIIANLATLFFEMATPHPTQDAKRVVQMILRGRYRNAFLGGAILLGNVLPLLLLFAAGSQPWVLAVAGLAVLTGIFFTEKIWVEAPQRIQLS